MNDQYQNHDDVRMSMYVYMFLDRMRASRGVKEIQSTRLPVTTVSALKPIRRFRSRSLNGLFKALCQWSLIE